MSARWVLMGGSVLAHAGIVFALGELRPPEVSVATSIQIMETPPSTTPAELEPPPPPEAPPPPVEPPRQQAATTNPRPAQAPAPEPTPASERSLADLPDFGLELSGGGDGPGLAVAPPSAEKPAAQPTTAKTLGPKPTAKPPAADPCSEGPAKPKLVQLPQPAYTDAARTAGVEGKVRVQITVDETGKVLDVKTLSGLGHGLDEAAVHAARSATFQAAVRCGKPTSSTFTVSIRFSAS